MKRLLITVAIGLGVTLSACGGGGDRDACVSSYVGTFDGVTGDGVEFAGVLIAQLDYDGVLTAIARPTSGLDQDYNLNGTVDEDGVLVEGGSNDFLGSFNFDECIGSGTWDLGFLGGNWRIEPREPGLF